MQQEVTMAELRVARAAVQEQTIQHSQVERRERTASHRQKRRARQALLWWMLPAIIIAGWWLPWLGFFVPACMFAAWGIALAHGRSWCNWMCPRGAFHDQVLSRVSRNTGIPLVLRSLGFRVFMLVTLMTVMIIRLSQTWGNLNQMGLVFLTLLTITSVVGIVLGMIFHQRTWCSFCPAGTVSSWIGRGKPPRLLIQDDLCTVCKRCEKLCPMRLRLYDYRTQGIMNNSDCLKCGLCATGCPSQALSWQDSRPADHI